METEVHLSEVDKSSTRTLQWLALSLTPGIGAGRGRKLVELFDGIDRVFRARLTELEGAGLPDVFRTPVLTVFHAARARFAYSSMTSCGVR